ncbi:MAG: YjbE family putative metal transport protein [Minisyncoccia bacterium]
MTDLSAVWPLVQIIVIDALMAADNAIVVGMAAASVPADKRRKVIVFGTMAAVVLRIGFALVAVQLLKVIGLMFAGGLLLAYVAYDMYRELRSSGGEDRPVAEIRDGISVLRAIGLVVVADVSMSLDNVLAVAGAAEGNITILVIGLAVSVALMAVAASALATVIHKHRWVAWAGLLMVAYVAVSMIIHGGTEVLATVAFI